MGGDSVRRLHRSQSDRMIGGVIGGLGEFFGIDSTILRLVFVLSIFLGGWGLFFYIVALLLVPLESEGPGSPGNG